MEIPGDVKAAIRVKRGYVYSMVEESFESKYPHYYVILNKGEVDFEQDPTIFLVWASSNVARAIGQQALSGLPVETFVIVETGECSIFNKRTVFNCNQVKQISSKNLITKIDSSEIRYIGVLPEQITQKLLLGISNSTLLSESIKVALQD